LLQTIPLFLALAVTVPKRYLRVLCGGVGLVGLVGLAATLSRWPWALAAMQVFLVLAGLTWLGIIPAKRALGTLSVGAFALIVVLVPFRHKIVDRFTRDFGDSVEYRLRLSRAAFEMFKDYPFAGVGLNNSRLYVFEYNPELEWLAEGEELVRLLNLRSISAPENGYTYVLTELGLLGLGAFLFYLVGVLVIGMRALSSTEGYRRAACYGLLVGVLGVLIQQFIDFSFWVDPLLYTFTLVVGMLNCVSVLSDGSVGSGAPIARADAPSGG
jgi:O-antigen ligase